MMIRSKWLMLSIASLVGISVLSAHANAASPLGVVNAISTNGGVAVSKDLAYGDEPLQNLDVYYPKALSTAIRKGTTDGLTANYPLVLFVHGGSWESGNKEQYQFVGESFAKAGYVTAVINYRKAPEHVYPAYVEDTAKAIAWLSDNANRFYADNERYAVVGHSAGAFNVVAAVSNADFLSPYSMQPSDITAVIGMAGPYSFDFRNYNSRVAFPESGNPDHIMPDKLIKMGVDGKQPDYLLLTAENDDIVHDKNTVKMTEALQTFGVAVQTTEVKGASHATSIGAMSTSLTWLNDVRKQVLTYLDEQLNQ